MKYSVIAQYLEDTGRGIIEETVAEEHGLSEKEASDLAKKLAKDESNHVFVSFFRQSDGQHGYLNRDGHSTTGERW